MSRTHKTKTFCALMVIALVLLALVHSEAEVQSVSTDAQIYPIDTDAIAVVLGASSKRVQVEIPVVAIDSDRPPLSGPIGMLV